MTLKEIKKKIDNVANKINKRIREYTKLDKIIPEIKHVYNLLQDSEFSKFVKNDKFKRGVSNLSLDEQLEYLEQLEQISEYAPTKTEAQKIINEETEIISDAIGYTLNDNEIISIGNMWGWVSDNIPEWSFYLSSEELNESFSFINNNNNNFEIVDKLNRIKDILNNEENKGNINNARIKIFDILYEEQERY